VTLRLHRHPLSGHCHRVELFLSLLGLPFENVEVDLLAGAHKRPEFLARNAFGQIPVLDDGEVSIADSNAILMYLAMRHDSAGRWLPREPLAAARVQRWLSIAAGPLASGPAAARLVKVFNIPLDHARACAIATQLFDVMEQHLATQPYLAGNAPTIADVASYAYTACAPEGDVSLAPYPFIRAWLERIEALPGFVAMTRTRAAA
jgi:glutathione S-transferase